MRCRPVVAPLALVAVLLGLVLFAPVAGAVDRAGLRSTLSKLHNRLGSYAGAYVVNLSDGAVLYAHRDALALAPASNEKLFTTSAALLRFGPSATLTTSLAAAPGVEVDADGVLHGDLYLVGGGDPTLGDTGLTALADQLAAAGVTRIDGGVIGDESAFDTLRGEPDSGYKPDSDLGGWLTALSWRHGAAGATGPARAAATKLATLLKACKIKYDRRPRAGKLSAVAGGGVAADAAPLATLASPPIRSLIQLTNVPSENFYAEMLVKALGAHYGSGGTTAAGLAVVRAQLAAFGVHPKLVDGSGLSRADQTTARQLVRLLERMDGQDTSATWRASLPIAGKTGTLRSRMRGTAAAGRCAAKTGTLIGVSALSGYCTTTGGQNVAFSFIENRVCNYCAKKVEDRMVSAIARLDG
ncbi:D-alanyl-D-alanine carboxypeptidase [Baekduia alba]|uniref:D-alanyl-D-alanine carboxypeptidase/D-alanyl-D-alanine endopeptidase n=1 Tax=Baekduia alba TaxID=2997333 RepID=UPI002342327C|nr:D-alanyl-D-alanine carboxypeptidase/D-alanyl-D-alanine-endopeptidase [Baekduia alba]WCB96078.1 D-alanyl-D-alanine carboxypeptidase [Baekduia alba]